MLASQPALWDDALGLRSKNTLKGPAKNQRIRTAGVWAFCRIADGACRSAPEASVEACVSMLEMTRRCRDCCTLSN